jgi:hypothetical protein
MPGADFAATFDQLRTILEPFGGRLLVKKDSAEEYSLDLPWSEKWKRELFFGAVRIGRSYVSFHLMPVYMFPDLLEHASAGLKKRMQGKSCFNFKRAEPELFTELNELTALAIDRLEREQLLAIQA